MGSVAPSRWMWEEGPPALPCLGGAYQSVRRFPQFHLVSGAPPTTPPLLAGRYAAPSPGEVRALEAYKSASSSDSENHQPSKQVIRTWCDADAVCFDVDSTVCLDEGIDELADFCEAGQAVAQWTAKAMAGSVAFEEALAARLSLFKPSIDQVQDCIENRPSRISPGISELIERLKARNTDVYLVSGGFRQMIKKCRYKSLVMVGDGATDLEARQPGGADLFICYGGVQMREAVARKAD